MRGGHLAEIEAAQRITFVARYAGKAGKAGKARQARQVRVTEGATSSVH